MAQDPYSYPGTDVLRNKLGITNDAELTKAEQRYSTARCLEAARLSFAPDARGYRDLHRHLFQDVYEWAGQDRTVQIGKGGSMFAAPSYVAREMDKLFADMAGKNNFKGLTRDEFFDRLGNHVSELNAIHPFREGNGRTMRQHAAQVAREAGHPIRIVSIDKTAWMEASRHSFVTGDYRGMAAVFAAAAVRRDLAPEARLGPAGIAMLPDRNPPEGQRYRVLLTKVHEELSRYLPAARQQATERVRTLAKEGASSAAIANARTELAYVQHAKGPIYQAHLLNNLGIRQIDAVVTKEQTPLERVREIGAALGVQIRQQQPAQLQRAVRALERPVLPPGYSPHQERLAALFLKNTPEKNLADPRLAPAQAVVDAAIGAARERGDSARAIGTIGETTRQRVAEQIKTGGKLDAESVRALARDRDAPTKDKSRGR